MEREYGKNWGIVIDPNGEKKKSIVDIFGRITNIVEYCKNGTGVYEEYITKYRYNLLGQLTNTIDNEGNKVKIRYDNLGRKILMNDPDMGIWEYIYDKAGNLKEQIDAKGQMIQFD